jgi:lipopolysaccharide transport system ATP-binding protein
MTTKPIQTAMEPESDVVLRVENLRKKFCRTLKYSMFYGVIDSMRSMLGVAYATDRLRKNEFWALEDVCFELHKGETLGIVGANGSGKSTLLRLVTGIYPPDSGRIAFRGRIGALIAVGAGFHPHMTGRENIYLNGTILGMTRREINDRLEHIIDFADIGDFLEAPVATYSSGMRVRLGFAIAIHSEPDILLIDEILAVGDLGFQLKCFNKLGALRQKGVATVLVTHNLHHITTFCTSVLVLNKGKKIFSGNVEEGLEVYKKLFSDLQSAGEVEKVTTGTEDFIVEDVLFIPSMERDTVVLRDNENLEVIIKFNALKDFNDLELDCVLRAPFPMSIEFFQANNHAFNKKINVAKGRGTLRFSINGLNLNNVAIYLFFALWSENKKACLVWWRNIPIKCLGNSRFTGMMKYPLEFLVEEDTN